MLPMFFCGSESASVNNLHVFKIIDKVVGPGVISNSRTFGRSFDVSQVFFFSGI